MGFDSYKSSGVIWIALTPDQLEAITKEYGNGEGGFQRLFQRLQLGIGFIPGAGLGVQMHPDDARRVVHYARNYGQGGWQNALRSISDDVERTLGPENLKVQCDLPFDQ